jgi:hypothetical protein
VNTAIRTNGGIELEDKDYLSMIGMGNGKEILYLAGE